MKIVVFGASVTQQGVSRAGCVVGYVPNLKRLFSESGYNVSIIQKGFGSTAFDSAGFLYHKDIVSLNPDVVIMEWHTTWLASFNTLRYATVMDAFLRRGISVINLVLPRRDCIFPERDCVKQSRAYVQKGAYFLNLNEQVGASIDLDYCLRDYVHTNEAGGKEYALRLFEFLTETVFTKKPPQLTMPGSIIEFPTTYRQPVISTCPLVHEMGYGEALQCKFAPKENSERFQLFADMKLGPYSPRIKISREGQKDITHSIWDLWCGYERYCLKALTPVMEAGCESLSITIDDILPDYRTSKYDFSKNTVEHLKCIFTGRVYCIDSCLTDVRVSY